MGGVGVSGYWLAIDTATDIASVAVGRRAGAGPVQAETGAHARGARRHATEILRLVDPQRQRHGRFWRWYICMLAADERRGEGGHRGIPILRLLGERLAADDVQVRTDLSFEVIDREKEMIRLGAGGLDGRKLTPEAMHAALQVLSSRRSTA